MQSSVLLEKVVCFLESKKAQDIKVIDISNVSVVADFFIICTGSSTTHIKTLADVIVDELDDIGFNDYRKEGYKSARWILIDLKDIVVHIFHKEDREFYNLERLWSDGTLKTLKN